MQNLSNNVERPLNIAIEVIPLSCDTITGIGRVVQNYIIELQKIDLINNYFLIAFSEIKHVSIINKRWNYLIIKSPFHNFKEGIRDKWIYYKNKYNNNTKYLVLVIYFRLLKIILECFGLIVNKITKGIITQLKFKKYDIDVYLGTSPNYYPKIFLKNITKIAIVYDLVWKYFPETMLLRNRISMILHTKSFLMKTDLLVAISKRTKEDIIKELNYKKPVVEIPLAADANVFYRANISSISAIRKKYGLTNKYILTVCTLEPRKNIHSLLKAFNLINDNKVILVIAGMMGWIGKDFKELIIDLKLDSRVILTGYVPNEELSSLYSGAEVFVYPSLYEGFGLPVLEAMQCGCPVITSNNSSMPEVAGDAGILVNALSIDDIYKAIDMVMSNKKIKRYMLNKGLERAKAYSWEKSGKMLLNVITGNILN